MESRQKLLDEMSREMEGYANSVRSVVRYAQETGMDKVRGPLNRLLSVPREYETAMDMVLGNAQQNVVTEDEETAKAMIEFLRKNRLGRAQLRKLKIYVGKDHPHEAQQPQKYEFAQGA